MDKEKEAVRSSDCQFYVIGIFHAVRHIVSTDLSKEEKAADEFIKKANITDPSVYNFVHMICDERRCYPSDKDYNQKFLIGMNLGRVMNETQINEYYCILRPTTYYLAPPVRFVADVNHIFAMVHRLKPDLNKIVSRLVIEDGRAYIIVESKQKID